MAIDFPNSPTFGQLFVSGTNSEHHWRFNGTYWEATRPQALHALVSREANIVLAAGGSSFNIAFDTADSDPFAVIGSSFTLTTYFSGWIGWHIEVYKTGDGVVQMSSSAGSLPITLQLNTTVSETKGQSGVNYMYSGTYGVHVQETGGVNGATVEYIRMWLKKL